MPRERTILNPYKAHAIRAYEETAAAYERRCGKRLSWQLVRLAEKSAFAKLAVALAAWRDETERNGE